MKTILIQLIIELFLKFAIKAASSFDAAEHRRFISLCGKYLSEQQASDLFMFFHLILNEAITLPKDKDDKSVQTHVQPDSFLERSS